MRKTTFLLSLAGVLLAPALASAQAVVELRLGLPVVLPQLVVVAPGIQVVPDVDEEVFFTSGFYWVRRDDYWYRSPNPRRGWVVVPGRAVPPGLTRMPPGQYRHWHPGRPPPGPAYRGGPVYRGGGPAPVYRGGPAPVYRGGPAPVYRGGPAPVYRGGGEGEWKHREGGRGEREWKHHDEGGHGEGHHGGGKRGRGKDD